MTLDEALESRQREQHLVAIYEELLSVVSKALDSEQDFDIPVLGEETASEASLMTVAEALGALRDKHEQEAERIGSLEVSSGRAARPSGPSRVSRLRGRRP